MEKELLEMTNEELWALFPIQLCSHDPAWAQRYIDEAALLERAAGSNNIVRISHIGSTAVPGLVAKPTIDILLEIVMDCDTQMLTDALQTAGYICTPQPDNPPPHLMLMKGYTPQGFAGQAFHVHIRYSGDWDELYFRDYLRAHQDVADAYGVLKTQLQREYTHDRDGYTQAKTEFISKYTHTARDEYKGRYAQIV